MHATNQFWGLFQEENDHRPEPGAFVDQGEVVGLPPHRHGSWDQPPAWVRVPTGVGPDAVGIGCMSV